MPTNFPAALDTLTNPTAGQNLNSPSHSKQHADANDAIEAIEAFIGANGAAIGSLLNPIGTIREFNVATNPATLLGFGTWEAYGTGRVTVAIDAGQTEFDTVDETGGAKTHTLTEAQMPSHTHTDAGHAHADKPNQFYNIKAGLDGTWSSTFNTYLTGSTGYANIQNKGGGQAHNNLQPYIVVYRWVRTA